MNYKTAIIIKGLKFAWKSRQLSYFLTTIKLWINPRLDIYQTWWNHEICKVYRLRTMKGQTFADSFDGLPLLYDEIPKQVVFKPDPKIKKLYEQYDKPRNNANAFKRSNKNIRNLG